MSPVRMCVHVMYMYVYVCVCVVRVYLYMCVCVCVCVSLCVYGVDVGCDVCPVLYSTVGVPLSPLPSGVPLSPLPSGVPLSPLTSGISLKYFYPKTMNHSTSKVPFKCWPMRLVALGSICF